MIRSIDDYKIILTNSAIIVNDYNLGDCYTLERNFKIWDPITHSYKILGMYYDPDTRKLYLPRGCDVNYVKMKIQSSMDSNLSSTIVRSHSYGYTVPIGMKYKPKNDRQEETLRFTLCRDKYQRNTANSQFSVNLTTGAGKTYCATGTISCLGIRSIIITAQTGILNQWIDRILEYTNLPKSEIVMLNGSSTLYRIIQDKSSYTGKSIYLATHSTLQQFGSTYGWDKVGLLFEKLGIGIKIIDEAHMSFLNTTMIDFFTNVWRTYYLTATPNRSDTIEDKIFQIYMKNVPSISLFDSDNDPHTGYISLKFNSNPKPSDITACNTSMYGLNRIAYVKYLMKNDRFWIMFDYIFAMIYKAGGKALFYIGTNEAILTVKDRILHNYPELWNDVGVYTSIVTDSDEKALAKEKRYILTTTKSAGAGEDIKHLKYSVVLAEPFKSEVLARQSLGRTRDPNTTYMELVDVGFRQLVRFYNAKKHVFEKYALSCKNINIDNQKLMNLKEDTRMIHMDRLKQALYFNEESPMNAIVNISKEVKLIPAVYFYK